MYLTIPWQHFYYIFSSFCGKLSWKISLLAICEFLGLFINTLTSDNKYFICNKENLRQAIQIQLFKKQKNCSKSIASVMKFTFNFKYFEKKRTLIAYVFPNLQTAKDQCLKIRVSGHSSPINILKGSKDLRNLHDSTYIIVFHHFERN